MIGRLRGIVVEKIQPWLLLEVGGVGYELEVSLLTFSQLPANGEEGVVYTHLSIREDAHLLYGFMEKSERDLFRELIKISGVGPKLALTILSSFNVASLVRCVQNEEVDELIRIPGVGKKTAGRLLVEMQGRLDNWSMLSPGDPNSSVNAKDVKDISGAACNNGYVEIQDAVNALISLGYKQHVASKAVHAISNKGEMASTELVKKALQAMMP